MLEKQELTPMTAEQRTQINELAARIIVDVEKVYDAFEQLCTVHRNHFEESSYEEKNMDDSEGWDNFAEENPGIVDFLYRVYELQNKHVPEGF